MSQRGGIKRPRHAPAAQMIWSLPRICSLQYFSRCMTWSCSKAVKTWWPRFEVKGRHRYLLAFQRPQSCLAAVAMRPALTSQPSRCCPPPFEHSRVSAASTSMVLLLLMSCCRRALWSQASTPLCPLWLCRSAFEIFALLSVRVVHVA